MPPASMKAFSCYGAKLDCARSYESSQLHPQNVYSMKTESTTD